MKKLFGWVAALAMLVSGAFSGCTTLPVSAQDAFFAAMNARAYPRIYKYLSEQSKERYSLEEMIDRYETAYNALGVTNVACHVEEVRDLNALRQDIQFSMTLTTKDYGDQTLEMVLPLSFASTDWVIEWSPSLVLPGMEDGDKLRVVPLQPKRGEIFDKNGELMAKNSYNLTAYVDAASLTDPETFIRLAAQALELTEDSIRKKIIPDQGATLPPTQPPDAPTPSRLVLLKTWNPEEITDEEKERALTVPGLLFDDQWLSPVRVYPNSQLLAHVLGYTGPLTAEDLKKPEYEGVSGETLIGKSGLEKRYDIELRGTQGVQISLFSEDGQKRDVLFEQRAVNGEDLHLTIDAGLQQQAQLLLMQYLSPEMAGCILVLDPKTGFVETIASGPTFDPNDFTLGMSAEQWDKYNSKESNNPLLNRATQGLFSPGSSFKPFTAAMALEEGKITKDFVFNQPIDGNAWTPEGGSWSYPPIRRQHATVGDLNLKNALIQSDNIYFAYAAMQVGQTRFMEYCHKYGFGKKMQGELDMPIAQSRVCNSEYLSSTKMLADSGYGQGEMLITPVQMATLFASLYNGGTVYVPKVVEYLAHTQGAESIVTSQTEPEAWLTNIMKPETLALLQPSLRQVVQGNNGTANQVEIPGLNIAGKTGTAQVGSANETNIAWFIGYTNRDDGNDKLVCVILDVPVDEGGVRLPITKAMFQAAFPKAPAE